MIIHYKTVPVYISVSSIVSLLRLCLEATYLSFRRNISAGLWNSYGLTSFGSGSQSCYGRCKERALNSYPNPSKFRKRYVDDVCVAMKKDKFDDFLSHLNSIELTIQFTVETEDDDNTLPFLDTFTSHGRWHNPDISVSETHPH